MTWPPATGKREQTRTDVSNREGPQASGDATQPKGEPLGRLACLPEYMLHSAIVHSTTVDFSRVGWWNPCQKASRTDSNV